VTVPSRRQAASRVAGVAVLVAGLTGIVAITVTAGVDGAASVVERVCGGLVLASIVAGIAGPLLKLPKRTVRRYPNGRPTAPRRRKPPARRR
jgi:hypothetical protein